ncbi:gamma-tubulin complex component 2-like [Centruroides vittatus]|uniref:gamma-tubulin complex component 2-like n=1 Tax=Centruroides vittatus TaxID=120091 RepID=UPI00350FC7D0
MSEFKIHHHVSELVRLLGVQNNSENVSSDFYAELLLKNRTPNVSSKISALASVKKLAENATVPEDVYQKYEQLRSRNLREVDPLVYLLSNIASDEKTKRLLKRSSYKGSNQAIINHLMTSGALTEGDVLQLQERLQRETVGSKNRMAKELSFPKRPVSSGCPHLPSWMAERLYVSWDFIIHPKQEVDCQTIGPVGALPISSQEDRLIEDLLYCLGGIEGNYINPQPINQENGIRNFTIDETADPSIRELVKRILPVCSQYSTVMSFIEEKSNFHFGLVNHALAAAMRYLLKDYFILIAQLEHQHRFKSLSLQKLWFYIQPTVRNMEVLAAIAIAINKGQCSGGSVLSILHERISTLTGDPKAHDLCLYLTQAASVPYFEIVEKWIYKGIISDPYSEFLVEDNELIKKDELPLDYSDDYWEKRYTIQRDRIPIFLERITDKILSTGKYLNVIRQCGNDIKCPHAEGIIYTVTERQYVERIETAYNFASKKLLDLLMEGSDLLGRLKSVKHYFLLDQGDFIVQFMDMAEDELAKDIDDIMPTRLESLLELALRTSVVNSDKYKDDVKVELLPYDLLSQMFKILRITSNEQKDYTGNTHVILSGLEAFAFDYEVQWPLSLVINRKALACYQMLFRHLFYCKHVERLLGNVWTLNKVAKCFSVDASCSYASAFALRQHMLNFIQNLEYYMMFEVIEPNWHTFVSKIQEVSNVDDVLTCHGDFLDSCLKDCMLTHPEGLQTIVRLLKLCVTFANFMHQTHRYAIEAEISAMFDSTLPTVLEETEQTVKNTSPISSQISFQKQITSFHTDFASLLFDLLEMISGCGQDNYNDKMVNMLYRLDFNGFYSKKQDKNEINKKETRSATSVQK